MRTLELYAIQRCLYDWYQLRKKQAKIQEIDVEKEIIAKSQQILHKIFKDKRKHNSSKLDDIQKRVDQELDKVIFDFENEYEMSLSSFMKDGIRRLYKMFTVTKRIALVGPICSGKSTLLKLCGYALKKIHNKVLNYSVISPKTFTYGELYGSPDNIQAYSTDIEHRNSIYSIILEKYASMDPQESRNIVKSIVIDSDIDEVNSECTIQ